MGFFAAFSTAWRLAAEGKGATDAARDAFARGGTPFDALRAFADATEGRLDDEAVAHLEAALRTGVTGLHAATRGAAWVAAHEDDVRRAVDAAVGFALDAGYRAGQARMTLERWLATSPSRTGSG